MALTYLNIYHAFVTGAQNLKTKRQQLNDINVFPVADGDTGTNMVTTLNSVFSIPKAHNLQELCDGLSEAVSFNAKGNSGAILAQFVIGFTENITEPIHTSSLVHALNSAVEKVYEALSTPIEGTIITIMKDWAKEVERLSLIEDDLKIIFNKAMKTVHTSLENTPNLLKVLKEYHVVDSGAKGFVHFIEGFIDGLFKDDLVIEDDQEDLSIQTLDPHHDHEISERYCTEFLLDHPNLDINYKALLDPLGSSLLVVQSKKRVKIHIHTNHPEQVAKTLYPYGDLIQQKADDMILQNADLNPLHKIALVTDSIADLPDSLRYSPKIHVFPLNIMVGPHAYLDRLTLSSNQFYEACDSYQEYPSSSLPNASIIEQYVQPLLNQYASILVLSVSSKMSGTYATFAQVAKKYPKIFVFDTKVNSAAQGLLVLHAIQAIEANHPIEKILEDLTQLRKHTRIFVSVSTLKTMVKMGRVSARLAKLAALLNMKPVVSIDEEGNGIILGLAFGHQQRFKKILKQVDKALKGHRLLSYAIVHGQDLESAQVLADIMKKKTHMEASFISEISTIVAMSAGPKTFAIALQTQKL